MPKQMSDMCLSLARIAKESRQEFLAYLLRLAGQEALARKITLPDGIHDFAGTWDWDVANDLNHLCPAGAELFGKDPIQAAKGLPNAAYLKNVHFDDQLLLNHLVSQTLSVAGPFEAKYRVRAQRGVRWIAASGHAVADEVGRVIRFQGVMFDTTPLPTLLPHRTLNS